MNNFVEQLFCIEGKVALVTGGGGIFVVPWRQLWPKPGLPLR